MKKIILLCLALMLLTALSACGKEPAETEAPAEKDGKLRITVTIFPAWDWLREVLGEETDAAEVTLLLGDGVDLHSYNPTVADIVKIADCDLFIYVGGESDAWIEMVLPGGNPKRTELNLMEILGDAAATEEFPEGMQGEAEEEPAYDEHVWLSLRNAQVFVQQIAQALQTLDPARADTYGANAAAYIEKLQALDKAYEKTVGAAEVKTLLFADRFPFRYLVKDYGLSYYAAFAGCSAETEASFATVTFLAGKADEMELPAVLTIEGSDGRLAETVVQNTKHAAPRILSLNSLQAVTEKDILGGMTYLSVMEKNRAVLEEALTRR